MFVYFLQEDEAGNIKIGTASNVYKRLAQIQSGNSRQLVLRLMIRGSHSLEKQLHKKFAACRIRGEWFRPSEEIEAYIQSHQVKPPIPLHISDNPDKPICAICARVLDGDDLVQGQVKKSIDLLRCKLEPSTHVYCCVGGKNRGCEVKTEKIMDYLYPRDWGWDHVRNLKNEK